MRLRLPFLCRLLGHRWKLERFDGRGRRIELAKCSRCRLIDTASMVVKPRNRQMRRRWAREVARSLAR